MTRAQWLCSISAASILFFISGSSLATAQEGKAFFSTIKKSRPFLEAEIKSFNEKLRGLRTGGFE